MREALVDMPAAAVPAEYDCAEQHLHPAEDRIGFADEPVQADRPRAECALVDVELEVHAKHELRAERPEDEAPELPVRGRRELPAVVGVPEDNSAKGE